GKAGLPFGVVQIRALAKRPERNHLPPFFLLHPNEPRCKSARMVFVAECRCVAQGRLTRRIGYAEISNSLRYPRDPCTCGSEAFGRVQLQTASEAASGCLACW